MKTQHEIEKMVRDLNESLDNHVDDVFSKLKEASHECYQDQLDMVANEIKQEFSKLLEGLK